MSEHFGEAKSKAESMDCAHTRSTGRTYGVTSETSFAGMSRSEGSGHHWSVADCEIEGWDFSTPTVSEGGVWHNPPLHGTLRATRAATDLETRLKRLAADLSVTDFHWLRQAVDAVFDDILQGKV